MSDDNDNSYKNGVIKVIKIIDAVFHCCTKAIATIILNIITIFVNGYF